MLSSFVKKRQTFNSIKKLSYTSLHSAQYNFCGTLNPLSTSQTAFFGTKNVQKAEELQEPQTFMSHFFDLKNVQKLIPSIFQSEKKDDQEDKTPPKGFEKFFKRKEAKKTEEKESAGTESKDEKETEAEKKEEESKEQDEEKSDQKKKKSENYYETMKNFYIDPNGNPKPEFFFAMLLSGVLAYYLSSVEQPRKEVVFLNFMNDYLLQNKISEIKIKKDRRSEIFNHRAEIDTHGGERLYMTLGSQESFLAKLDQVQRHMGKQPAEFIPVSYSNTDDDNSTAFKIVLLGIIGLACYQIYKGRGGTLPGQAKSGKNVDKGKKDSWFGGGNMMGNMTKSSATVYGEDKKIDVRFTDVAGNENAKQEVLEFVDFLKNPKKYQALGARVPRGALLCGPPGTGKTLLAKAVAGEAGVPFVTTSGSEFVEMFVGVGASRVRDIFKTAREKAPSIIFIDEIDAVGKKRAGRMGGGNEERDNTLNQLLVEMDGFSTDSSVIVLAATNRADSLDSALLRPGRFDRQVDVTLPSIKEREQIFNVHLKKITVDPKLEKGEYACKLAALTPGFSGADIMNICNEGAIIAARREADCVTIKDFEMATERVIAGIERKLPQSKEELRTVAYHEAGHAVAGWFSQYSAPLIKLTIIPRAKGSLGFAQYLPDELTLYTQQQLEDMITVALGGRIAEEIFFKRITTGASDDLKKCTQIAQGMVTEYGLSPVLGNLNYSTEGGYQKNYSEKTNKMIDDEIHRIIQERYHVCKELLLEKQDTIEKLAEELLAKETLSLPEIVDILGPRPFPMKETLKEYLTELRDRKESDDKMQEDAEQLAQENRQKAKEQIKFDPDAAEPAEGSDSDGEKEEPKKDEDSKDNSKEDEKTDKDKDDESPKK